jgi:hypothetical protein
LRQVRLVLIAGVGILALCGVAVATSLMDYVSHRATSVAHVPPVVGPAAAAAEPAGQDAQADAAQPAPLPSTPTTSVPVQESQPAAPAPALPEQQPAPPAALPARQDQEALLRLLEQLRHRRPPRQH